MRASMVCEPSLAFCARDLELGQFMLLGKGEENTGGRRRDSITSDGMEAMIGAIYLDGKDADKIRGKRVCLLDDVISTGESLTALEKLVEKAGGNICGRMAILAEGDAQEREDIIYLEKLPLFNPDGTVLG